MPLGNIPIVINYCESIKLKFGDVLLDLVRTKNIIKKLQRKHDEVHCLKKDEIYR